MATTTTATDSGTVVEVSTTALGDELASDHAAGATTLTVKDAVDFADDGGWLTIGAERIYYDSAVDDETNDVGILTLSTPTAGAYAEGERVVLDPPSFEKYAQVMVGNFGEAQQARIGYSLWDRLADGIRADGEGEVVTLDLVGSEFVVADVIGSAPLVDGSYLDPTIPLDPAIVPPAPPSPPEAPTASPTPVPSGGVRSILVTLPPQANDPTTQVQVYVSTTSPVALDAAHLHGLAQGTLYEVGTLADGTPLTDLAQGTVVYVVARATNAAGDAVPSPESSASLRPVDAEDFAVGYLYAGAVQTDQLTGGTFALASGTVNTIEAVGVNGERLGMSVLENMGFYSFGAPQVAGEQGPVRVWFPIDGKPNIVSGQSEFDDLTVNNTTTLRGTTTLTPGATRVLGGQVQPPATAPQAVASYDTVQHVGYSTASGWTYAGLTLGHDGNYRTVRYDAVAPSRTVVEAYHPTTGALVSSTTINGFAASGGIVYSSAFTGRYYMLGPVDGVGWRVRAYDTALALVWESGVVLANTVPDYLPVIGWDHVTAGGRLLVASIVNFSGVAPTVDTYNPTSSALGAKTSWSPPGGYAYAFDLGYIARVTTESGDRYVFRAIGTAGGDDDFQVFTTTATPTHQTSEQWPRANSSYIRGAWWDGTRFRSLASGGQRYRYETGRAMWTSGSATREVSYTLYDSVGTTHETTPSPKASVVMPKRARLSVTIAAIPTGAAGGDDPNSARVYVGTGVGVANGSMNLEKTIVAPNTAWSLDSTIAAESPTTHPPTTNGFPTAATPGKDVATSGGYSIDGASNGSVGTGTFRDSVDARVTAVGLQQTVSAVLNATGSFAGTVQFIKIGRLVTVVADVSRATGFNASFADIGVSVPVAFRPAANVIMPSAVLFNGTASYSYRIDAAGTVSLRQSAAFTASMTLAASYIVP